MCKSRCGPVCQTRQIKISTRDERKDKCHRKRRNGIGSQLMPSVCFAPSKARH
ncbi:hypothetical protein CDL15_Pgr024727 [Punica granatum]|uniref:Uncharacterized protein n=1 Tax=Punica granatum TaxID=22663 RepID=A0A218W6D4_PUNGR|nr:hypothetical protein CDL15_Pgr024727 [Punica granatum]